MAKPPQPQDAREGRTLAVAALVERITRPVRRRRGLVVTALFSNWADIVGTVLARESMPERLVRGTKGVGGTLHIRADGPLALELQHLGPQLVERINGHFGYGVVARVAIHQGVVRRPEPAPRPQAPVPDPKDAAALEARLQTVADPDLRRALGGLGAAVLARRR